MYAHKHRTCNDLLTNFCSLKWSYLISMLSFPSFSIINSISCCCCGHFGSFAVISCWSSSNLTPSSSMSGVYVCTHSHTHTPHKKNTEGGNPPRKDNLSSDDTLEAIWWISLWTHDKYCAEVILQGLRSRAKPEYLLEIIGDSLSDRVLMYETDAGPKT